MDRKELYSFNQSFQSFIQAYLQLEKQQHFIRQFKDLTLAEIHTIVEIGKNDKISMIELSKRQNISRSAISQMIRRLETKHLVKKLPSPISKIGYQLVLTDTGQKILKIHKEQQQYLSQELLKILNHYPPEIIDSFENLMKETKLLWETLPWLD